MVTLFFSSIFESPFAARENVPHIYIIFRIIAIDDNNYILKGEVVRLYADSPKEDLKIYVDDDKDDFAPEIDNFRNLDRNEYFYLPGKIVHLDQDLSFMNKCMNFYKKNRDATLNPNPTKRNPNPAISAPASKGVISSFGSVSWVRLHTSRRERIRRRFNRST